MARSRSFFIEVDSEVYIAAALMLLLIPLQWLAAWLIAAVFHEACHCLALVLCREHIAGIHISLFGAKIHAPLLQSWEQLFCTLSGPAGALLLLLTSSRFPHLAVCAFVQSVYNLLPILPLDGGHALSCALTILFSETLAKKIQHYVDCIFYGTIILLSFAAVIILKMRILYAVFPVVCLLRIKKIKIPCKSMSDRVQ